jgi:hypothetical protein
MGRSDAFLFQLGSLVGGRFCSLYSQDGAAFPNALYLEVPCD